MGSPYSNDQLSFLCGSVGTVLLHTPVRDGASKGKVERNFRTLKERWLYSLDISQIQSLEEFNRLLADYIRKHNTTRHSGTGQTPLERYLATNGRIRKPASWEWLEEAFHNRVMRNVNRDATVHLLSVCYDAPMQFIGQKVEVRFHPGGYGKRVYPVWRAALSPAPDRPCSEWKNKAAGCPVHRLQRRGRGMFTDYYGLSYNPFDKQNVKERDAFRSHDHCQMLSRLDYLKTVRGIGVFTVRPGMGKTYTLRCFMKNLNPNQHQSVYISLSTISVTEFYREFCELLGLEPQYLNYNILRDLKMLMNHSYDSLNCFSLLLVGEPYLNHILDKQVHEALRQRITVHYNYEGLSDQEISDYIYHKLELAGGSRSILEGGAVSAIHGYSEGNARKIDNLMTDALTIGAQQDQHSITSEIILPLLFI